MDLAGLQECKRLIEADDLFLWSLFDKYFVNKIKIIDDKSIYLYHLLFITYYGVRFSKKATITVQPAARNIYGQSFATKSL